MTKLEFANVDAKELAERVEMLHRQGFACQTVKTELRPGEFRIRADPSGKYFLEYACNQSRKFP